MEFEYRTADGTVVELEGEIAELCVTLERHDSSERRKARRHNEASIEEWNEQTGWEPAGDANLEAEYIAREERETLAAAVAKLSEKQQHLVRLYYYETKTLCEIAAIFSVSQPAVTQQLATVHKTLKKHFKNL